MTKPFDPDDDPAQVAAARTAAKAGAQKATLGEDDLLREDPANLVSDPAVPRDAATLILYRMLPDGPRILMGCRSDGHDFMPNKYVFPGGRVDDEDTDIPIASDLPDDCTRRIALGAERPAREFALTAVREMFEETGLVVGERGAATSNASPSWRSYFEQGAIPSLRHFQFLGRAITPPMRHKRFDARFFIANADEALIDARAPADSRELADLRWFTLAEVAELDLPNVTRFVISEIETRLAGAEQAEPFFLYWTQGGHVRERIS